MVAAKAKAAWNAGLPTIICIGETQAERRGDKALSVCGEQIARNLPEEVACSCTISVACEPLWAIDTGHVPTSAEIAEMHLHIRTCLTARDGALGAEIRILHGGFVTSENAHEVLGLPAVGGVLIGGASLKAADPNAVLERVPDHLHTPHLSKYA